MSSGQTYLMEPKKSTFVLYQVKPLTTNEFWVVCLTQLISTSTGAASFDS